ncbi:putative enzyme [Desulfamplus magnetovallimortis]|uniref:Putative enzyme n=1 Tax=Desulfamplus magnetovallimortis TaxID=1246637 RepID=A0A1W1H9R5_9BACT|nr:23S rRNA (uracil(1939)-C(5))-methyltransferase RlmD [Desulfamplus magnetovallimortis]SLM29155.1 putative enzyme [Desulfamplus magnetovallimortis]
MSLKKRKTAELDILDLAFGGKGIAKPDGFPVFVDRTIPGDRALVRIIKKKKKYAEGKLIDLIVPSPLRQDAPCSYANYCGGCRWQSLPYKQQLRYKKNHVKESLEHIGLLKDIPVKDVLPSGNILGFRNKMEFSCSNRRWLTPEELQNPDITKDFGLGLHVPGTFDKVIDIKNCLIQPEPGNKILEDIRCFIKESETPAYDLKTHEGFWRFVMLRNSVAYGTWMVNIVTKTDNNSLLKKLADKLMERYPMITSFVNNVTARKAGVATGEYENVIAGEQYIKEKLGNFIFEISANSFFQTNTRGAETLYSLVSHYAELTGKENVLDLYSGTGTIPIWLSRDAKEVTGIEIVESAVLDAKKNAQINGVDNCRFHVGDIRYVLPELFNEAGEKKQCDVMIIDPPRAGMHKDVVSQVIDLAPEKIVYVSCNPATLARDLSMLATDYKAIEVQPVDMFPHTFHIESVALLTHI